MSLSFSEKMKARLEASKNQGKKSSKVKDYIWKPTAGKTVDGKVIDGKHVIRIVPYQHQADQDDPFIQLKFHYDFNGKNYLSPSSFKKPDPIVELSERLKKNSDTWKKGRELEPKLRTFVPIIVRGEEEKGVRFWGFGIQIYNQLMETMSEPDYGDIRSLTEGYDIQVNFKTAEEVKKDYPETTIMVKPKPRPVIEAGHPKTKEIMELITSKQPNILDVYEVPSYETLEAALEEYLKKSEEGANEDNQDSTVTLPTEEQIEKATTTAIEKPVTVAEVKAQPVATEPAVSPTAQQSVTNVQDITKAFDNLFNS